MPPKKRANTLAPSSPVHSERKKVKLENFSTPAVQDLYITAFSSKRCLAWFQEYAGLNKDDVLGPEAMEKFCEDLGVEPENIVMLLLAWKLRASQMGFFTRSEWLHGMTSLQCDSMDKLKLKLDSLRTYLLDPVSFKSVYQYTFDFAKHEDQRNVDIDIAKEMLQLLLGRSWSLCPHFNQFLQCTKYQVMNRDQWNNVLEFSKVIHDDLSNYDEDGAWPVLLDEFVKWMRTGGSSWRH